jgi:hypothetical protein
MQMEGEMSLPMRLLQLVSHGGIRSTAELGKRLGVSEGLVTMMAEDLRRRGYLQALSGAAFGSECATGCGGCAIVSTCKLPGRTEELPLLALTEKGKAAVLPARSARPAQ